MNTLHHIRSQRGLGFSLIEVVLAIGIFLVTVLALVGLLGPTLKSVDDVEQTDEIVSVVNSINAFLQNSPEINPGGSKFNAIYEAVTNDGYSTLLVFRRYDPNSGNDTLVRLAIGFADDDAGAIANTGVYDPGGIGYINEAAGPIYRVMLTPSSVIPLQYHAATTTNSEGEEVAQRNGDGIYQLAGAYSDVAQYEEGYFAMEVRIFAENPPAPGGAFDLVKSPAEVADLEPVFTYNTAVVR